jgi:hypothetical protein
MIKKHERNIMGFIRKVYYAYFGAELVDQDKSWAPHKVCCVCVEDVRKWSTGKKKALKIWCPNDTEGAKKLTVMVVIFAVAKLRVTTLKLRKLSCT